MVIKFWRVKMINIYGKVGCVFCIKAKELCKTKEVFYTYESLTKELKDQLEKTHSVILKTVPVVLIDGVYIGGFQELEEYFNKVCED